jgi:hypothetical protein
MWDEADAGKGSHLWITSPAADEKDEMGIHTHGVRAFEQEILGRDSLLFVFQVPDDASFPYALGHVPGGYRAAVNDAAAGGRIFLHYGSVLVAVTASQPFEWDPSGGIRAPASPPRTGDSEFRVSSRRCAVALETALPAEFPAADPVAQLAEFRARIIMESSLECDVGKPVSATYRNRFGDSLACTFDGADQINGKSVDYKAWPVSQSPWTAQSQPDGPLGIRDGKSGLTYDFANWKIRTNDH